MARATLLLGLEPVRAERREVGRWLLAQGELSHRQAAPRASGQPLGAVAGRNDQAVGYRAEQGAAVAGHWAEADPCFDQLRRSQAGGEGDRPGEQATYSGHGRGVLEARLLPGCAGHDPAAWECDQVRVA